MECLRFSKILPIRILPPYSSNGAETLVMPFRHCISEPSGRAINGNAICRTPTKNIVDRWPVQRLDMDGELVQQFIAIGRLSGVDRLQTSVQDRIDVRLMIRTRGVRSSFIRARSSK